MGKQGCEATQVIGVGGTHDDFGEAKPLTTATAFDTEQYFTWVKYPASTIMAVD